MENMTTDPEGRRIVRNLFFRLLPAQIILSAIPAVNGIISSLFASNYIGDLAMTAIGLYQPVTEAVMMAVSVGLLVREIRE